MDESDKFYSLQQASEILGVSEKEILNMISLKRIPAVEEGEAIKIKVEDLEGFLTTLEKKGNGEEENTKNYDVKREAEVLLVGKKALLEKAYRELLKKKQELEEDINYLQYEYDEFKNRIKRLVTEELNMFLRKIERENLRESDGTIQDDFGKNLNIAEGIREESEKKKDSYDEEDTLVFENKNISDEK